MIRLLIADDDVLVREGIVSLLSLQEDIEVIAEASNGAEAVELCARLQPDIVLMDLRMPVLDGVDATEKICRQSQKIKILTLSTFDDDALVIKALRAGAHGYILKSTPFRELLDALKAVLHGHVLVDAEVAPRVVAQLNSGKSRAAVSSVLQGLSERQLEVFWLLGQGKTNEEIAHELCLSEGTIKNHISKILEVTRSRDRIQAALMAQRLTAD